MDMNALEMYLNQLMDQLHGIFTKGYKKEFPETERRWCSAERAIVDPLCYCDLQEDQLEDYAVDSMKRICRFFGRQVEVNGERINGLIIMKFVLREYKLVKPKLVRISHQFSQMKTVKDANKRINAFSGALSRNGTFNGYKQFGKLLMKELIGIENN